MGGSIYEDDLKQHMKRVRKLKVNLYYLIDTINYSDNYFDTKTGKVVNNICDDNSRYLKLPDSPGKKSLDVEFINSIENPHIRNSLLSNYGHADVDRYFSTFLENDYKLTTQYQEFSDEKLLKIVKQWAEENGIDYYISEDY